MSRRSAQREGGPLHSARKQEAGTPRHTLIAGLVTLGAALWLSSLVVDSHPGYAMLVGLTVLTFSARAADGRQSCG